MSGSEVQPLPRGVCPECGRDVALRRGGKLREHRFINTVGKRRGKPSGVVCAGSGRRPVPSTEGAADAT